MLFETCKSTLKASALIIFVCFAGFPAQGQIAGDKPSEEDLGVEYLVQCSAMTKYMAYVVGTAENPGIKTEDVAAIFDFELIYADRREKQGRSSTRYERTGRKITSSGYAENYDERRLRDFEHDWTQKGIFSREIIDHRKLLNTLPVDQKYEPTPELLNPLYLPLLGPNVIYYGVDTNNTLKEVFLPEEFHDSASIGEATEGVWIGGIDKSWVEIIRFDSKQGSMPTVTSARIQKPRVPSLDKCDPIKNSDPLSITRTKWKKHDKSGFWLPTEIESAEVHRYHKNSYEVKIYWWIDDEVPDEVFEFEDFKKAVIRRSKAHQMVETLKESLD
ncbi:MAG: hypothetical protein DWH99_13845 [Planctomycetota bacterium]|nr:MAG: hypothetical protein DWH99_13845 [Planctomycetota bacterium]